MAKSLALTQAVTQSVGSDNEKDFESGVSVFVAPKVGFFLCQAIRFQFSESRRYIIDFKEASVLGLITAVFGQPDPDAVSL